MKNYFILVQGIYCFIATLFLFLTTLFAQYEFFPIYQYGFGLDKEGNIYVGSTYDIFVYDSHGKKHTQFPAIYTKYLMTVDDERIFVKGTKHCLILDLNGNVLNEIEIDSYGGDLPIFSRYNWSSKDGTVYKLKNIILRPKIMQEDCGLNALVWQLPFNEYLARVILLLITVSDLLCALNLLHQIGLIDKKGNVIW